jgi:hypothetical protein
LRLPSPVSSSLLVVRFSIASVRAETDGSPTEAHMCT